MREVVAHSGGLLPCDLRLRALQFGAYPARRFTEDFQIAQNSIPHEPLREELFFGT